SARRQHRIRAMRGAACVLAACLLSVALGSQSEPGPVKARAEVTQAELQRIEAKLRAASTPAGPTARKTDAQASARGVAPRPDLRGAPPPGGGARGGRPHTTPPPPGRPRRWLAGVRAAEPAAASRRQRQRRARDRRRAERQCGAARRQRARTR